ncbi:hypothetical protein DL768_004174 [Monosporascus sp. mg162]|nr:hypothetical protein DL768_004174 [Monosporascus sp. mg162]
MLAAERSAAAAAAESAAAAVAAADVEPELEQKRESTLAPVPPAPAPATLGRTPRQRPAPVNARPAAVRFMAAVENGTLCREVDRF